MSKEKELVRKAFREAVLARDGQCVACMAYDKVSTKQGLVAHHITDRHEMPKGGYVEENGIALCPGCHEKAEIYHKTEGALYEKGFMPADLYRLIKSSAEKARQADAD